MSTFTDYMDAIFSDFIAAAERPDLNGKVKTVNLPDDRREEQYEKLKQLTVYGDGAIHLIDSRFLVRFCDQNSVYLGVQTESVNLWGMSALEGRLLRYEATPVVMDEATFLFSALNFKGYYKVRTAALDRNQAKNFIEIADEETYIGHEIGDVLSKFEDISLFAFDRDSVLATSDLRWIASIIATSDPQFRTDLISQALAQDFDSLLQLGNVDPENVYYGLTSVHWKHCYLDIYKCLEALYFLPWVLKLKNTAGFSERGYELSKKLRESLRWREKEGASIEALFNMLEDATVQNELLEQTKAFSDLKISETSKAAIARRVYKIRNVLVHQEDYDDPAPINISDKCWPIIIKYMIGLVETLYRENSFDVNFNYLLGPSSQQTRTAPI